MQCTNCSKKFTQKPWQIKSRNKTCPACRRKRDASWYEKRKAAGLPTGGKMRDKKRRAAWLKAYAAKPENQKRIHERNKRYWNDPRIRIHNLARWLTKRAIRYGKLTPGPCEFCGDPQTQIHHKDYTKPLLVIWVCKECHLKIHREHGVGAKFDALALADGREEQRSDEPDHDDTVLCCPDCERPNQFGELCESCRIERDREETK